MILHSQKMLFLVYINIVPKCDDYYISDCFLLQKETKPVRICIYEDQINSGGNDYVDGYADITYSICPKGHKYEVDRKERRK